MPRCSSVLVALLLLTSNAALAKDKPASKPDVFKGMPADLQLIGWSKDEKRFVVRKYLPSTTGREQDDCLGYVDHRGKDFSGGLSIVLYEGSKESQSWEIQDAGKCTPPEEARDKLAAAKAALAQGEIDLSVIGTVLVPKFQETPSRSEDSEDSEVSDSSTAQLTLPSGPWAQQTLKVVYRRAEKGNASEREDVNNIIFVNATFTVSLLSGKKLTQLAEYPLHGWYNPMGGGHWTPTFASIVLSPSGKRFVAIGHLEKGSMAGDSEASFIFGLMDLPDAPKSKAAR